MIGFVFSSNDKVSQSAGIALPPVLLYLGSAGLGPFAPTAHHFSWMRRSSTLGVNWGGVVQRRRLSYNRNLPPKTLGCL